MEVGQKVYLLNVENEITEAVVEKITRSLITLNDGMVLENHAIWVYDQPYQYYNAKRHDSKAFESKKNAMHFVKTRLYDRFDVYGYREIKYPTKPITPRMSSTSPSKDEIIQYQKDMEAFESDMKVFTVETQIANQKMNKWMDTYMSFLAFRDGLEDYPEEVRSAVYSMAYEAGHSAGYGEVSNYHISFAEFAIKVINAMKKNK